MTRKKEEATAGLRRGRTLAAAGLGAATLIAGLAYAAPANAATAPTITVTAPTVIPNDASAASSDLTIQVNNNVSGNAAITDAALQLNITIPAGLTCGDVSVVPGTAVVAPPVLAGPAITRNPVATATGTCSYQTSNLAGGVAAGSDVTYAYAVTINGTQTHPGAPTTHVTGTVSSVGQLDATDASSNYVSTIATSAADTSQLVTPGAPTFTSTAVPVANYGADYAFQLITSPGYPLVTPNTASSTGNGYSALGIQNTAANITTPPTAPTITRDASSAVQVTTGSGATATNDYYLSLNDDAAPAAPAAGAASATQTGFFLDTTSGKIVYGTLAVNNDQTKNTFTATAPTGLSAVNFKPKYTWVIVANNSTAGSGTAAGTSFGLSGIAKNLQSPHNTDVASAAFTLDVGFSDVPNTSVFLNDINTLAKNGIINGYIDGTYGPTQKVNREQFVAFAARLYAVNNGAPANTYDGSCVPTVNPSQFTDVPNTNQFCTAIQLMASLGVVKGYTATTFGPIRNVQRQEIAAFVTREAELFNHQTVQDLPMTTTKFTDVPASNIFSGDIKFVSDNGITKGATATTFLPHNTALRQEVAAFMDRLATDLSVPLI